ncbi:MAG: signal peptidase I [Butyrivibrio sp.]
MRNNLHDDDKGIEIIELELDEEIKDGDSAEHPSLVCQESEEKKKNEKPKGNRVLREIFSYVIVVAAALVLALAINRFVLVNAHVPSTSMEHTIDKGDRFLGFRLAYLFSEPERGDVVVFNHQCYDGEESMTLVKRIIGLPKDVVTVSDGKVYINGNPIDEAYLSGPMEGTFGPYEVPDNSYFLMGDNRNVSDDARYWDYPYVTKDEIIAKAWLRYKPEFNVIK